MKRKDTIDKVQLTIYFPIEWKKRLFEYAEEDGRTFNNLMTVITQEFMKRKGLLNGDE